MIKLLSKKYFCSTSIAIIFSSIMVMGCNDSSTPDNTITDCGGKDEMRQLDYFIRIGAPFETSDDILLSAGAENYISSYPVPKGDMSNFYRILPSGHLIVIWYEKALKIPKITFMYLLDSHHLRRRKRNDAYEFDELLKIGDRMIFIGLPEYIIYKSMPKAVVEKKIRSYCPKTKYEIHDAKGRAEDTETFLLQVSEKCTFYFTYRTLKDGEYKILDKISLKASFGKFLLPKNGEIEYEAIDLKKPVRAEILKR